jgi:hypothetical protein
MKVECGSKPGFSTSGWIATSTYQVNVIAEDKFQSVIDQILEKAPNSRASEVMRTSNKHTNNKCTENSFLDFRRRQEDGSTDQV